MLLAFGCGGRVVADTLCRTSKAPEAPDPQGCVSVAPASPTATGTLEYVCLPSNGEACVSPIEAYPELTPCLESKTGEGCDCALCGACTSRRVISVCAPIPHEAEGQCCYFARVVETTTIS
jgi:hypothetical protein